MRNVIKGMVLVASVTTTSASIALLLLAMADSSSAASSRSVRFQHVAREQGLSQSFVYAIAQDRNGYMWFGTQEGLNRFDGFEFAVFAHDPDDPESISDETVRTILKDRSGELWIGTDAGGLSHYNTADQSFTNYLHDEADASSIGDNRVRAVFEDSKGALWIGLDGSGLDRFDRHSGEFEHFTHDASDPGSLLSNTVWSILEDSQGTLWVATDAGLSRRNDEDGSFAHYQNDPDSPTSIGDNQLRVLFEDSADNFWIGTESGGLNRFDRANGTFERFIHDPTDTSSISANRINTIYEDNAGVVWVGTVAGLNVWNPDTRDFERYTSDVGDRYSLAHDNVLSIFQDRGDVLWVGTYDGLSKWNQATRAILHYRLDASDEQSLSNDTVTSFAENPNGDIWIGTFGGGLNLLDRTGNRFSQLRHRPSDDTSLSSDRVMALHVDSTGVLWAGTRSSGLNRYNSANGSFTHYRNDPEDPATVSSDSITYILEDRNENLWIGTFGGGLNVLDRETQRFTRFRNEPDNPGSLSNDRVLVLYEDSAGTLWIGTYGGGLNRFDSATGTFTHFRADPGRSDGLSGDDIYVIREDSRGDLWIGSKGAGLNRWRRSDRDLGEARFERISELQGLPSATVYSGLLDLEGHLWLSSTRGLSRLNTDTLEIRNYDTAHGLQGEEFNLAAGYRAVDGQLFFGGLNGFNALDPDLLASNRPAPLVAITEFLSLNSPVDLGESRNTGMPVELGYDQAVVSFEYAALDYAAPLKNRYMYQLTGLDKDWVDAGSKRQVTYSNLPAGNYTFKVRATNNDGVWSEHDAALDFRMAPAPWETWWAYLLYLLILTMVAVALFRVHAKKSQVAARLRYADELNVIRSRLTEAQRIAGIGNWDWNIETDELWWSDEVYRLFQVDPASFKVTFDAFIERVHPDDRESVRQAMDRALHDQEAYDIEHRIIQSAGNTLTVHQRGEVSFNEDGTQTRMVGTVHDITERKRAESEIRRNADFQTLLAGLSSRLMRAQPDEIDQQLNDGLEAVGSRYVLDAISIWWFAEGNDGIRAFHRWARAGQDDRTGYMSRAEIPWIAKRLLKGDKIVAGDLEQKPLASPADQKALSERGIKAILILPLHVDKDLVGACAFSTFRAKRDWSAETIAELRLVSESLAGAIVRSRAMAEIEMLKDQLLSENLYLREEVRLAHGFDEIVGEDAVLKRCLEKAEKVAPTDVSVLILGETGTGKELIARSVHELSPRHNGPMISVNCPTLPSNLIESELFGHEKGAFTGAHTRRRGRFELADGGTLFLDEIGDLPLGLQGKLLRVLQTGEFERLGGTKTLLSDVRLIAATNRDLPGSIDRGKFRADLYYRIGNFPIYLPPLRERKGDIPLLAEHFVNKHARRLGKTTDAISGKMLRQLVDYDWPGNIRELEGVIERALIASEGNAPLELPGPLPPAGGIGYQTTELPGRDGADLSTVERDYIVKVLRRTNWKISGKGGAAEVLGIPSSTLRSKMNRLGITRKPS